MALLQLKWLRKNKLKKVILIAVFFMTMMFFLSSCAVFKGMFDKVEKVPNNFNKKMSIKASEFLPENLADILPPGFIESLPEEELCNMLKDMIPISIVEGIIKNYYATPGRSNSGKISDNIKFNSSIEKHFDKLDTPRFEKYIEIKKTIEKSFFESVKKILKEKSSDIFLNPELEIKALNLGTVITLTLSHPQLSGEISVETSPRISKNDFGVNDRDLLSEIIEFGEKKKIKLNDDSDWVLISLMNKPDEMYLTLPATLNADLEIKDIEFKTNFEIDADFEISFTVNDVNSPVSGGYEWNISSLNIKKIKTDDMVISGFDTSENLLNADFELYGYITAGLK